MYISLLRLKTYFSIMKTLNIKLLNNDIEFLQKKPPQLYISLLGYFFLNLSHTFQQVTKPS